MLDDKINDILENLDVVLTTLRLKCNFFWKTLWIQLRWKGKRIKNIRKRKNKQNRKIKRRLNVITKASRA